VGAGIAAPIAEEAFEDLDASVVGSAAPPPPSRVSSPLDDAYRPNAEMITAAAQRLAVY
jgi:pyruvate/2-oxoglutarate/acetoin dehydrogenase E1 component